MISPSDSASFRSFPEARERREGRLAALAPRPLGLALLQPGLAWHHGKGEQDGVLDEAKDVQGTIRDQVIFRVAFLFDGRKLRLAIDENQPVVDGNAVPEVFEAGLAREKNEALNCT